MKDILLELLKLIESAKMIIPSLQQFPLDSFQQALKLLEANPAQKCILTI